jgi:hypothetical protein
MGKRHQPCASSSSRTDRSAGASGRRCAINCCHPSGDALCCDSGAQPETRGSKSTPKPPPAQAVARPFAPIDPIDALLSQRALTAWAPLSWAGRPADASSSHPRGCSPALLRRQTRSPRNNAATQPIASDQPTGMAALRRGGRSCAPASSATVHQMRASQPQADVARLTDLRQSRRRKLPPAPPVS